MSRLHPRGWTRRQVLRAGGLGTLGLGLANLGLPASGLSRLNASESGGGLPGFGRAKRCIFLFMWGGPSQLDTLDPKPAAPAEIRGEFAPIATNVPGIQISEHFSRLAQHTDQVAILRSLHHDDPAHLSTGHLALTGNRAPVPKSDAEPPSDKDSPHFGSVLSHLRQQGGAKDASGALPSFVTMPWLAYHPAAPGGTAPGQTGGWLGRKHDPLLLTGDPNKPDWTPPAELSLPGDISLGRLESRRELLRMVDAQRRSLDQAAAAATLGDYQQQAFRMLSSPEARQAFDLTQEPAEVRDRYGRHIHGQCVLLARRLIEHGVPVVNVNWHNDGQAFWDTHGQNFKKLKDNLIPPADQALTALITDLDERGLLDETIIAWVGEFGRKPQITQANAGREHWPWCYSGMLAGGGIRGGVVHGSSDAQAAYPETDPVSPEDYMATVLYALGVDGHQKLIDPQDRPRSICEGQPLVNLFG